jgi:hypothetical protein
MRRALFGPGLEARAENGCQGCAQLGCLGAAEIVLERLHRENRYDRPSDDVERVTRAPAESVETFVAARKDFYLG